MSDAVSTQIQLVSRPQGWPTDQDFRQVEVEYSDPAPGQVRVRNEYVSVDPYMRGRMSDAKSYTPPFPLGETMTGGAIGTVVASASDDLPVGTQVEHQYGWRDVAQADASGFRALPDLPGVPTAARLGILGMTGLTAYVGLTRVAHLREGETVFVSGAAGAVGSAVGQFARLLGASRVVGSVGSDAKAQALTSRYGFDAALNYKDAPVREQLPALVPDGVDVYYDNVGGDHLEAAIDVMNPHGRAALCGSISGYNDIAPAPGPDNLGELVKRRLRLEGFLVGDHPGAADEFAERAGSWLTDGRLVHDETVVRGIDHAVQAFLDMMAGANTGKMLVAP